MFRIFFWFFLIFFSGKKTSIKFIIVYLKLQSILILMMMIIIIIIVCMWKTVGTSFFFWVQIKNFIFWILRKKNRFKWSNDTQSPKFRIKWMHVIDICIVTWTACLILEKRKRNGINKSKIKIKKTNSMNEWIQHRQFIGKKFETFDNNNRTITEQQKKIE